MSCGPEHLPQPGPDGHQRLVAGGVAEAVVDDLEPVEVDEQHGQDPVPAVEAAQRLAEPVHEQRTVGQSRQRIVEGQLRQGFGRFPLGGDVLAGAGHLHRLTVDGPDPSPALQPPELPRGGDGPVGEIERLEAAQAPLHGRLDQRPVVGVHEGEVALERSREGLRA